jgi:predicted transposase/invertase (TIGR01784 family)
MQLLLPTHFKSRILHYWAGMFHKQIHKNDEYAKLRPTISICLVNQALFPAVADYHLIFELVDVEHAARFTDLMQIHVLQLPKLDSGPNDLHDDLEAWLYLFRNPESIDPEHLPERINQPVYLRAIEELEMLTKDDQERMRYESRLMAIRDQQCLIEDAREDGLETGLQKGEYIGRIHLAERLLKRPQTPSDDLVQLAQEALRNRADKLEAELTSGGTNSTGT